MGEIPLSIASFMNKLENKVRREGMNSNELKKLLHLANISVHDVIQYANFDHPIDQCYGRQWITHAGYYEIVVYSWNPGYYSSIHDFGQMDWGVCQAYGDVHSINFGLTQKQLYFKRQEILKNTSIIELTNSMICQLGNPTSQPLLTLHVYGSDSVNFGITNQARHYELESNRVVCASANDAFFNLSDPSISAIKKGIRADDDVFVSYAKILLDYYNRLGYSQRVKKQKIKLLQQLNQRFSCDYYE